MPLPLLSFDFSGAVHPEFGVAEAELAALAPRLARVRGEILGRDPVDPSKGGFIHLPERLLAAYQKERAASELGRIMAAAARLRDKVDRVVVLGGRAAVLGGQALREACCQPYFNELSRGERGGYPRIYFAGNNFDNDAVQGLLYLLGAGRPAGSRDHHWGIVILEECGETLDSASARNTYLAALRDSFGGDMPQAAERMISIATPGSRLHQFAQASGIGEQFILAAGTGGPLSVLSAVGLIPAALMGLDVLKLLEGAKVLNDHFRTAAPAANWVLQFAGVTHLLETKGKANLLMLCPRASSLEAAGQWCAQLLAERLGKRLATVSPENLLALSSPEGRRDSLLVNLLIDEWRFDSLAAAGKTLPDLWIADVRAQREIQLREHQPAVDLRLPGATPHAFGQFFQCWMLAAEVEDRLRESG